MDLKMFEAPKILLTTQGEPRILFSSKENANITELYFKKDAVNGIVMISETGTVYRTAVDVVDEEYIAKRFQIEYSIDMEDEAYDEFMSHYMLEEVKKLRSINKEELK